MQMDIYTLRSFANYAIIGWTRDYARLCNEMN